MTFCKNIYCQIQPIPLQVKTSLNLEKLFNYDTCNVSVQYLIYNTKKKVIVKYGENKPKVKGKSKISIHAEEIAMKYCINNRLDNRYHIYIWRWSKDGKLKPKYCCESCCKLAKKLNFSDRIFTFEELYKKKAISLENKYTAIGNLIRNS